MSSIQDNDLVNIIDSHVHFFDAGRSEGIVWPATDSPVYGFGMAMPEQRLERAGDDPVKGLIAVETSRRAIDDRWLQALSNSEQMILGAVLNLQPDQSGFSARFEAACSSPKFVGVRLRPIAEYDLGSRELEQNLRLLEQQGKTIELGAPDPGLKSAFAEMATALPATRLILDHAGHPQADSHTDEAWLASMRKIAACPNVFVKVTTPGGEFESWRATLDVIARLFGSERLIYGSNWPVSRVENIVELKDYFRDDSAAFFYDNARTAYRV